MTIFISSVIDGIIGLQNTIEYEQVFFYRIIISKTTPRPSDKIIVNLNLKIFTSQKPIFSVSIKTV